MAKISARGSYKLAEGSYTTSVTYGNEALGHRVTYHFVLRSDGTFLKASSWPDAKDSYDRRRKSYTVTTICNRKLKKGVEPARAIEVFNRLLAAEASAYGTVASLKAAA